MCNKCVTCLDAGDSLTITVPREVTDYPPNKMVYCTPEVVCAN